MPTELRYEMPTDTDTKWNKILISLIVIHKHRTLLLFTHTEITIGIVVKSRFNNENMLLFQ